MHSRSELRNALKTGFLEGVCAGRAQNPQQLWEDSPIRESFDHHESRSPDGDGQLALSQVGRGTTDGLLLQLRDVEAVRDDWCRVFTEERDKLARLTQLLTKLQDKWQAFAAHSTDQACSMVWKECADELERAAFPDQPAAVYDEPEPEWFPNEGDRQWWREKHSSSAPSVPVPAAGSPAPPRADPPKERP